ncbi:MAG TPA: Xaa-Pro peptidase family protein [Acidimicrobiales bacterium]
MDAVAIGELPAMDVAGRIDRLRALFDDAEIDALIVTNLRNVRYLTGFTGTAGHLVVTADDALLVTDERYGTQADEQLQASGVPARAEITTTGQREVTTAALVDCARIGLEAASITWARQRELAREWFPDAQLVPTDALVERLRLVKDAGEVARIELAATIADAALDAIRERLLDGPTEAELALELDTEMRRRGASERSFETIVASGPNGAKPHARPGTRRIRRGDLVVIDFGAMVDGYRSDMTRTLMVGEPSEQQRRLLDVVTAAQAAGVAAVGPDVAAREVDAACREVIATAGWGDWFVHGTGHGVGLDIHEAPWVNARSAATLAAGHVVTVEPGVYLPEVGGVRVEDTVVVTEEGNRPLTRAPKDPIVA